MWKKKFTHSNVRTQLLTISLPIKYALRWAKKICCHFVSRNVHLLIKSLHWIVWTDLSEIHNMVQHWVQWKAWNLTVISFCKCGCLANKHGVITVIANRPKEAGELILTIKLRPFCTWTIFRLKKQGIPLWLNVDLYKETNRSIKPLKLSSARKQFTMHNAV